MDGRPGLLQVSALAWILLFGDEVKSHSDEAPAKRSKGRLPAGRSEEESVQNRVGDKSRLSEVIPMFQSVGLSSSRRNGSESVPSVLNISSLEM